MKGRVLVFLCLALIAFLFVPFVNLGFRQVKTEEGTWWSRSSLYNIDFALPFVNLFLYHAGISTKPAQVVIGKNGWLYLGDQYRETITAKRFGPTEKDREAARNISLAARSWETYLKQRGVRLYRVILAPDKATVYPEFLPEWAKSAPRTPTDALLACVSPDIYVDGRPALRAAKTEFSEPLYYKTDTHWDSLGAWVAFRAFAARIAEDEPELRLLSEKQLRIGNVRERQGGGLANLLRIKEKLRDDEVTVRIVMSAPVETEQYDYETGRLKSSGGNPGVMTPTSPLLVKSENALNRKRVIWLRDSFGFAMAPFMAAMFTDVLQLHYVNADPACLAGLVDDFDPDYVFITAVERDARSSLFENLPPASASFNESTRLASLDGGDGRPGRAPVSPFARVLF